MGSGQQLTQLRRLVGAGADRQINIMVAHLTSLKNRLKDEDTHVHLIVNDFLPPGCVSVTPVI